MENFGRDKRRKDGIACWCKACNRANSSRIRSTPEGAQAHRDREKARYWADPIPKRIYASEYHWRNHEHVKSEMKGRYTKKRQDPDWVKREMARLRATQLVRKQRVPPWLTKEHGQQIEHVYAQAAALTAETGVMHHVDHIVPLQGKTFSGLHVPWNLEAIPASENFLKSNKLPDESRFRAESGF